MVLVMAMIRRMVVLVVGLGLVGASGVIDAAAGSEDSASRQAAADVVDAASSLDGTRARQLASKAAGSVDAAIAATTREADPSVEVRPLSAAERREILGGEPRASVDLQVNGTGGEDAYLELVSRGGHVDLRSGHAHFHGSAEVFRGPLRPAAYLVFKADPKHRYLVECNAWAQAPGTTLSASDGEAVFEVGADERVSLLYRGANSGDAVERVTVVISADRPEWFLESCELSSAPL